jgi:prepilin signal peptidase PulO-like enzyme (type II secretory pathway)
MAACPFCKRNISWRRFLKVIPNWNPKLWMTCNYCKSEIRPRYWLLWLLAWYASSFALGAILISLLEYNPAPPLLLVVLWVAYLIAAPLFLVFAKFTGGELSKSE